MQVQISQVTSSNPQVAKTNLRVRTIKQRVARLKARVGRLKPRFGRLKAQAEAIKPRDNWNLVPFFYLRLSPKKQTYYFLQRNVYTNVC